MKTNLSPLPEENWNKESVKCNNVNDILIFEFFIYLLNFTLFYALRINVMKRPVKAGDLLLYLPQLSTRGWQRPLNFNFEGRASRILHPVIIWVIHSWVLQKRRLTLQLLSQPLIIICGRPKNRP